MSDLSIGSSRRSYAPMPTHSRYLHKLQSALSARARVSANLIDQTIHGLTTAVGPHWVGQLFLTQLPHRPTGADHPQQVRR